MYINTYIHMKVHIMCKIPCTSHIPFFMLCRPSPLYYIDAMSTYMVTFKHLKSKNTPANLKFVKEKIKLFFKAILSQISWKNKIK